jgi:hypothetical protein
MALSLLCLFACSNQGESPRQRVLNFVKAVQADSLPDVLAYVDADSLATYLYIGDRYDSLSLEEKRRTMLEGFMRQGDHRAMYSGSQIVVNDEKLLDDTTATVEVSYIERKSRIQYYTQMGLKKRGQVWYIVNLRVE